MQEHNLSTGNFESCLKCNICTTVCPMMAANPQYPGPKQAGPDGERYRLKDPGYYDLALRFCLGCKRCEVACPSGVKVGDIIQMARLNYGRPGNTLRNSLLAHTDAVGGAATGVAPAFNAALASAPVKSALDRTLKIESRRTYPEYARQKFSTWMRMQDQGGYSRYVSYFHGCYVNYNFPQLGKDFVTLMNACGYGVHMLEREKCCGMTLIANGFGRAARAKAKVNAASIRKAARAGEPVLTTSASCTYTIRDEYKNLLGLDVADFRDSVLTATRWLYDKVESGEVKLVFKEGLHRNVTYHTACHMQKLGWAICSIELLRMVPGFEITVPDQQCCGMAGTFGYKKENYQYSQKIGEGLFHTLESTSPDIVVTDCETCKWQIEMSTGLKVMNPVSLLVEALDIEKTVEANRQI